MEFDYKKQNAVINCTNKIHFIRALRLVFNITLVEAFEIMHAMGKEILKCEQIDKGVH
mgnify:CR=1 FL=1